MVGSTHFCSDFVHAQPLVLFMDVQNIPDIWPFTKAALLRESASTLEAAGSTSCGSSLGFPSASAAWHAYCPWRAEGGADFPAVLRVSGICPRHTGSYAVVAHCFPTSLMLAAV
eukprot:6259328-Amphidinium_carterae.1